MRWDFTVSSDEEGWCHAAGYCVGWKDPDETNEELRKKFGDNYLIRPEEADKMRQFQSKYHKDGHATSEEASACHDEYELDFELRFSENPDEMLKCVSCGDFTTGRCTLGAFGRYVLCSSHQTREDAQKARDVERASRRRPV
jgi:hypothetical protein